MAPGRWKWVPSLSSHRTYLGSAFSSGLDKSSASNFQSWPWIRKRDKMGQGFEKGWGLDREAGPGTRGSQLHRKEALFRKGTSSTLTFHFLDFCVLQHADLCTCFSLVPLIERTLCILRLTLLPHCLELTRTIISTLSTPTCISPPTHFSCVSQVTSLFLGPGELETLLCAHSLLYNWI